MNRKDNGGQPFDVAQGRLGRPTKTTGFTLIELLTSMGILALMMIVLFSVFDQVNKAWLQGENRVETFTQARAALDFMSRELTQAIATPNVTFFGDPTHVYFVAPVNTGSTNMSDLCEVGYQYLPGAAPNYQWEIERHFVEPNSGNVAGSWIYNPTWWTSFNTPADETNALAANCVLNLGFQYEAANGTFSTTWGNPNKLPYAIVISMSVVDSRTATKLGLVPNAGNNWVPLTNSTLRSFSTTVYLPNISP